MGLLGRNQRVENMQLRKRIHSSTCTVDLVTLVYSPPQKAVAAPVNLCVKHTTSTDRPLGRQMVSLLSAQVTVLEARILQELLSRFEREFKIAPRVFYFDNSAVWRMFTIVMEDLSVDYMQLPYSKMVEDRVVRNVLQSLARMHAWFWNHDTLASASYLPRASARMEEVSGVITYMWNKAAESNKAVQQLSKRASQLMNMVAANMGKLGRALDKLPWTLMHGDFHPGNTFLKKVDDLKGRSALQMGKDAMLLVDWQQSSRGPGVADISYFLAFDADLAADEEKALVYDYWKALVSFYPDRVNEETYPWDLCWKHYLTGFIYAARSFFLLILFMDGDADQLNSIMIPKVSERVWNVLVERHNLDKLFADLLAEL